MATPPVKNIAIIGAGGHIGKQFVTALLKAGKDNIIALTRPGSTSGIPAGIKKVEIDYDDEDSIVSALKGQQFLVISLSVRVPEDVHGRICKAAAKAGVSYIMPNFYGGDPKYEGVKEPLFSVGAMKRIHDVEATGIPWIVITTGFWYEWSLALGEFHYGIDINKKVARFCDEGREPINTTTWPRCGEAFAALLCLPESGASPCLADYKNHPVYIDSFSVTQRQILDSVQKATGTTDKDWDIKYEPAEKRYKDGLEEFKAGNISGFAKALYAHGWSKDGRTEYTDKLDNEKFGLEREDLDVVTREVVEKVQTGWNPWAAQ